ncbi:unnamed protein product [Arabidopsis arenosa]|uniref:DUF4216 domain-containing protein n=1 Tax=Arabidopsis arenosa TaxID=38785 RepID=A0A8S2AU48_ARAAE|nr:unnamed protein product [Arabidopsis arenosa]
MLLWSISDYPALGTLAGCKVKGKQACNVCGKDTPFKWLKFSRKHVYLSNRKRLSPGHHYRRRRGWFDNTIEEGTPSRIQTGEEIFEILKDFRNDFGRPLERKSKRKRTDLEEDDMVSQDEYDEDTDQWRWKKLSILFQLPYWKDGLKARKDLEDMGIRSNLHTQLRGKRTYLPPAAYWLSKEEKRRFCSRLARFRGPDGYCANISNCVSVDPPVIGGLKSHDHHVLLQNLLPVALRGLLPKGPRVAISRLCNYFSRLCQRVIDPEKLITLESELVETLYMKTLKAYVKNFARPEACMAEGYLAGECMAFCLEFLQNSLSLPEAVNRNEDVESNSLILEGRTLQKATQVTLTSKEREIAHRYVLMNMAVMDPYINLHLEELQATDARCMSNETLLWKMHADQFLEWIKEKIPTNSTEHSTQLRWLAFGPRHIAQTYKGFVINGHRFHTDDMKRKTQNSGVTYEAFSMCRSSAKDTRLQADIVTYFGVIKEIILLDYHMFQVPIFKCHWANKGNGVKEEDGFTLVNLHLNQSAFLQDPYILAAQAKQVFYSREDDSSPWYVVMKAPPRGYHELETEEEFAAATIVTQDNVELGNESDDESFYVRNDCEGMSPKVKKTMPRRSKRKQGIELSSEVGLQVHRRSKKNVTQKVDIGEQEHEENLAEKVHIEQQEHESVAQEHESVAEETVADVLGSDLAAEEQEIDEQADEEDTQPNDEEVHQPVHEDMGPEEAAAGEEEQVHHSTEETQTQQSVSKKRKTRGPTRMRKIAKQHDEKVDVEFTSIGEHVGNGSVSLSSFLGPLVREHVPVLLDDWRHLSDQTRDTLWEEIQGRFNLTEDWQKDCVFKQMGCVWRASKSKLTTKVRAVKSKAQLLKLKPSNIESVIVSSHLETLAVDVVADSPRRLTALCGGLASEIEISGSAFSVLNSEWSLGACRGGVWDLDYASLRATADKLGALLLYDMPHISGLISAQVNKKPTLICIDFVFHVPFPFVRSGFVMRSEWVTDSELATMEETTDGVNNMNLAVDSQKKNRIQVSNTKKPLFFYVNLAKRQDVWSLQLLESLSGSIVPVSSRCNAYVCRSALFPGNGNEGPILKSTAIKITLAANEEKEAAEAQEISEKYRKLRQAQIPHTTSRKGMNRLAHEMSSNPKLVTRSKVWVAGHTHSDGRPVRPEFAETIEKIKSIDSEMGSSSTTNLKEDAVSQVLGKDKPGRLRGMGRGVTATKLAFMLARDSHVEKLEASQADLRIKLEELQDVLTGLTGKKDQCEEVSKSEASDHSKGVRCQLLDWCSEDDVVVGEGEFCSAEQWYKIGRIPLGRHAVAVIVKSVSDETASLWRPTPSVFLLGGALGTKIAWPFDKIILDNDADSPIENKTAGSSATDGSHTKILIIDWNLADSVVAEGRLCSTDKDEMVNNMPLGHSAGIVNVEKVFNKNAYLWRPSPGKFLMKDVLHENIAWPLQSIQFVNSSPRNESAAADKRPSPPLSLSNSTGSTGSKSVKKKCILLDCKNSREKVAEGRVCPSNPSDTVHHMPLGANASKVWVEVSKVGDAAVWRPNSEIQTIADAVVLAKA